MQEFKDKLVYLERQHDKGGIDDTIMDINSSSVGSEGSKKGYFKLMEGRIDTRLRASLHDNLQLRRFKSSISASNVKRTFSRDLFHVDRGKLRARHEQR